MKNRIKKTISVLLVLIMIMSILPLSAGAQEGEYLPEPGYESGPATEPGANPETEPATEPETQPATEPETEPETEPATGQEPEPESGPEPEEAEQQESEQPAESTDDVNVEYSTGASEQGVLAILNIDAYRQYSPAELVAGNHINYNYWDNVKESFISFFCYLSQDGSEAYKIPDDAVVMFIPDNDTASDAILINQIYNNYYDCNVWYVEFNKVGTGRLVTIIDDAEYSMTIESVVPTRGFSTQPTLTAESAITSFDYTANNYVFYYVFDDTWDSHLLDGLSEGYYKIKIYPENIDDFIDVTYDYQFGDNYITFTISNVYYNTIFLQCSILDESDNSISGSRSLQINNKQARLVHANDYRLSTENYYDRHDYHKSANQWTSYLYYIDEGESIAHILPQGTTVTFIPDSGTSQDAVIFEERPDNNETWWVIKCNDFGSGIISAEINGKTYQMPISVTMPSSGFTNAPVLNEDTLIISFDYTSENYEFYYVFGDDYFWIEELYKIGEYGIKYNFSAPVGYQWDESGRYIKFTLLGEPYHNSDWFDFRCSWDGVNYSNYTSGSLIINNKTPRLVTYYRKLPSTEEFYPVAGEWYKGEEYWNYFYYLDEDSDTAYLLPDDVELIYTPDEGTNPNAVTIDNDPPSGYGCNYILHFDEVGSGVISATVGDKEYRAPVRVVLQTKGFSLIPNPEWDDFVKSITYFESGSNKFYYVFDEVPHEYNDRKTAIITNVDCVRGAWSADGKYIEFTITKANTRIDLENNYFEFYYEYEDGSRGYVNSVKLYNISPQLIACDMQTDELDISNLGSDSWRGYYTDYWGAAKRYYMPFYFYIAEAGASVAYPLPAGTAVRFEPAPGTAHDAISATARNPGSIKTAWNLNLDKTGSGRYVARVNGVEYTIPVYSQMPDTGFFTGNVFSDEYLCSEHTFNKTGTNEIWFMKQEGFTTSELDSLEISVSDGYTTFVFPGKYITYESVERGNGSGLWDLKINIINCGNTDMSIHISVPQPEGWNYGYVINVINPDAPPTSPVTHFGKDGREYTIGFGNYWEYEDGIRLYLDRSYQNAESWYTEESNNTGSADYYRYAAYQIYAAYEESRSAYSYEYEYWYNYALYIEADPDIVSIKLHKVWLKEVYDNKPGGLPMMSLSEDGLTSVITNFPDGFAPVLYYKDGHDAHYILYFEFSINGGPVQVISKQYICQLRGVNHIDIEQELGADFDDVDAVNAFLAQLASTINNDESEGSIYSVYFPDAEYEGDIIISPWRRYDIIVRLFGARSDDNSTGNTVIKGGINLNGSDRGWNGLEIHGFDFTAPDTPNNGDITSGVYNGGGAWVIDCTFQGYNVAADATESGLYGRDTTFTENDVAVRLTRDNQWANSNWIRCSFVDNDIAVQEVNNNVGGGRWGGILAQYSNFINNNVDIDIQVPGIYYDYYCNYFGTSGGEPRNPVIAEYDGVVVHSIFNRRSADFDDTQFVLDEEVMLPNGLAGMILIDENLLDGRTLVITEEEEPLGTWVFPGAINQSWQQNIVFQQNIVALSGSSDNDAFNAGLSITQTDDKIIIIIDPENDAILGGKKPTLTIPVPETFESAYIYHEGVLKTTIPVVVNNEVSFTVEAGGRYAITANPTETRPEATINYQNNSLTGLVPNASYSINGALRTAGAGGSITIETGWYGIEISIIKTGGDSTADSEPQLLQIPSRPAAPAGISVDVNDNITGVNTAMEYKQSSASVWTSIGGTQITGLEVGIYNIRLKATGGSFASVAVNIVIEPLPQEDTPEVMINFMTEELIGFIPETLYMINGEEVEIDATGSLPIEEQWLGTTISIVRPGRTGTSKADSTADSVTQTIVIPNRPSAPSVGKIDIPNGSSTGTLIVSSLMEYKPAGEEEYIPISGTFVTGLPAGTYCVRYKATSVAFASTESYVRIVPEGDIMYGDVNGDGKVNGTDVQTLVLWLNSGCTVGSVDENAAKVVLNSSPRPDATDVQAIIMWINSGGRPDVGIKP